MTDRKNSLLMKSGGSVTSSFSDSSGRPKSLPDRRVNMLKKRTPALSDKKTNPDFFRKLEGVRDSVDWQIEVAVPRESPHEGSPRAATASSERLAYQGNRTDPITGSAGGLLAPEESNDTDLHYEQEEGGHFYRPPGNVGVEKETLFFSFGPIPSTWPSKCRNSGSSWDAFVKINFDCSSNARFF